MTPDQFWQLVEKSRLYRGDELESLRKDFALSNGDQMPTDARPVAEWLLEQRKITGFQARQLLKGKVGPFQFGEYQVLQRRIVATKRVDRFDGVHVSTRHRVILHLWPKSADVTQYEATSEKHREIRHANLDRYYETVFYKDSYFGVSECPEGETLRQLLDSKQRLPISKACHVAYQAAVGLAHLHAVGLAHGCLRPDEIVVQSGGHVKLTREPFLMSTIDLKPLAKVRPSMLPNYLAPEFHRTHEADARSDIYALGCILYEAILGRPPFPRETSAEVLAAHLGESIEYPEDRSDLPNGLWEVISYATAKDRNQRYRKAIELAEKLEPFLPAGISQTSAKHRPTETLYLSHLEQNLEVAPKHLVEPAKPDAVDLILEPTAETAKRSTTRPLIPYIAAMVSAVGLGIVLAVLKPWSGQEPASPPAATATNPTAQQSPAGESRKDPPLTEAQRRRMLWASPTDGPPVDLAYTPAGAQLFVCARVQQLMNTVEGQRALRALGPDVAKSIEKFEAEFGVPIASLERLTVCYTSQDSTEPKATMVGHFDEPSYQQVFDAVKPESIESGHAGRLGTDALFFPEANGPRVIVWGPVDEVQLIQDEPGTPPLRREMEQLLRDTDAEHDLTILLAPNFLASDGQDLLKGPLEPLRQQVLEFVGDQTQAACVGAALGESFYIELKWVTRIDENPLAVAQSRRQLMTKFPEAIFGFLDRVRIDRFWQPLAIRYPRMVQYLSEQTRVGVGDGYAIMNAAMPPQAAHNLILATELALANIDSAAEVTPTTTAAKLTTEQILETPIDLQIAQQSLEMVIAELARTVRELPGASGFQAQIIGGDLQGEGITRNQQIRNLSARRQTVRSVLTEIARRGNPLPVDDIRIPDQKLIWVPHPTLPQGVIVTTRTAAAGKGYEVPREFVAE